MKKFYLSDKLLKYFSDTTDRNGFIRGDRFKPHDFDSKYAYTITTGAGNRATDNFIKIPEATKQGYKEAYEGDGVYLDRPHQKRGVVQSGMIQTLKTSGNDVEVVVSEPQVINPLKDKTKNGWHFEQNIYDENGITRTVKAGGGSANIPKVMKGLRIRKLTPLECFRLMGFDDSDFHKAELVNSNTQLYKQAGNNIVVNVLEAIFKQLF